MKDFKEVKKGQFLIWPMLIGVFIFLATIFLLRPKIAAILTLRREIADKKKVLAQLTQKVAVLEGLDQAGLPIKVGKTLEILPAEKDVPRILSILKAVAVESGASFKSFQAKPGELAAVAVAEKESFLPALDFTFELESEVEALQSFLPQTETIAPLTMIKNLTLLKEDEKKPPLISLECQTFFLPLAKALDSAETPVVALTAVEEMVFNQILTFRVLAQESEWPFLPAGKADLFAL